MWQPGKKCHISAARTGVPHQRSHDKRATSAQPGHECDTRARTGVPNQRSRTPVLYQSSQDKSALMWHSCSGWNSGRHARAMPARLQRCSITALNVVDSNPAIQCPADGIAERKSQQELLKGKAHACTCLVLIRGWCSPLVRTKGATSAPHECLTVLVPRRIFVL
jgi:hypothetical protein